MAEDLSKTAQEVNAYEQAFKVETEKYLQTDSKGLTVKQLALLIVHHKLDHLKLSYLQKMLEWKENRAKIQDYTVVLSLINARVKDGKLQLEPSDSKEEFKYNLRAQLEQLVKDGLILNIPADGLFDAQAREGLVTNLKGMLDGFNLNNNIVIEDLQQIMNERYEAYQYARGIMKPENDAGTQVARNIAGR